MSTIRSPQLLSTCSAFGLCDLMGLMKCVYAYMMQEFRVVLSGEMEELQEKPCDNVS